VRERDEEGRPIATRNAGAFLAPVGGVVPAPSSMLDEEGSPSEPSVDPQLRPRLRLLAVLHSVAVWAVLGAAFRYVLAATERAAEVRPVVLGDEMTRLMHTDASWYLANTVFLAIGLTLALRRFPARTRDDWLWVGGGAIVAAIGLGLVIASAGGYSAALIAVVAIVWLVAQSLLRRRLLQA